MNRAIGISLIGIGGYGARLAQYIKEIPGLELVSCYHPERAKVEAAASKWNCQAVHSIQDVFESKNTEAVVVASPDHTHLEYLRFALEYGKKYICRKASSEILGRSF